MKRPHGGMAAARVGVGIVAAVALAMALTAAEDQPRILLDPNTTKSGEQVTVHGFNFCGDDECSLVRIVLEDEVRAGEVEVGPDGYFAVAFEALAPPGVHDVFAIQDVGPNGDPVEAVAELTLGVGEQEPGGRQPIPR